MYEERRERARESAHAREGVKEKVQETGRQTDRQTDRQTEEREKGRGKEGENACVYIVILIAISSAGLRCVSIHECQEMLSVSQSVSRHLFDSVQE